MRSRDKMTKLCQDYTNEKTGKTYPGCGQPLKFVNDMPLVKIGEWPGGKPKYQGRYFHYDGSPSRHDESNPPNKKAYQDTYPQQIEKQDQEQAQLQTAGYADAKTSSMFEQFVNTKLQPFMDIMTKKFDTLVDNADTKAASNNVGIVSLSRDIDQIRKEQREGFNDIRQLTEAIVKSLPNLFQGADKMYTKNPAAEVIVSEETMEEGESLETGV